MDTGLELVIKAAGSATRVAGKAVQQWKRIPAERVIQVEAVTGVPRQRLRPELYLPRRPAKKKRT
jgi:DNA-binding transcriptional regulator YdaS (Cro superfamily)